MRVTENETFRSRAAEAVQSIPKDDLARYVWFFHEPSGPHLLRTFLWRHFLKLLWIAGAFLLPWAVALASFEVAQVLCLFFVFVVWPAGHLLALIGRHAPGVPSELRRMLENASGAFDAAEVLGCCFFLIAHPQGLWHSLFESPADATHATWLIFLGENVLEALTLGAASELGWQWSNIQARGVGGGLVSYGVKFLFAATFLDSLLKARRWYMGGEFFTGSHIEAAAACRDRTEVPGSYLSRIGQIASIEPVVFAVRAMSEYYPTFYMPWLQARHHLEKPIMSKLGDEALFGREASAALGVTHVAVERITLGTDRVETNAVTVYHTKFLPTADIRAELDLADATLTLRFNQSQCVRLNPLSALRCIAGEADARVLVLCELEDLQVVGVRLCALLIGNDPNAARVTLVPAPVTPVAGEVVAEVS